MSDTLHPPAVVPPRLRLGLTAQIGDDVWHPEHGRALIVGLGLDGMADLSTGDTAPAAELVLLWRAWL